MKLIDKDALVAEINRRIKEHHSGYLVCLKDILSFLDTLEVKEVDLETEQRIKDCPFRTVYCERFEGTIVECNGKCSRVVDYPKIKEFKAQKGE